MITAWSVVFLCMVTPGEPVKCGEMVETFETQEACEEAARAVISAGDVFIPSRTSFRCDQQQPAKE
jgi:hypothetical protein